jgi:phosphoribosylglycinamide formyltransferase-1
LPESSRLLAVRPSRIVVLISGQGRNLQALLQACADGRVDGRIVGVISNRADAVGLVRAREAGVATLVIPRTGFDSREAFDQALSAAIDAWAPQLVLLAGFMRVLTAGFVQRYRGRLLNIHPSLLPRHPGLHTHRRVIECADAEHGATVHFVTEDLDGGPAIIQGRVRVLPQDTPDTLADRVMQDVELKIYPQAVAWMARGELCLDQARAVFRGGPLHHPLTLADLEAPFA